MILSTEPGPSRPPLSPPQMHDDAGRPVGFDRSSDEPNPILSPLNPILL
jgi:hypothetical protein